MPDTFPVSARVAAMNASSTLKAAQAAADLRDEGHNVIDLTVGEPDFDTPSFIKQFAIDGLEQGLTKYTPSAGLKRFREAVSASYGEQFDARVELNEVAASCGGKQALFNAACTILNPGDEFLIPSPYWVTFPEIGTFCGAKNVVIDTSATHFVLTADAVRDSITDRSKLLVINSPNNPTGRVVPDDEMVKIVEACAERDVYVLTDECYLFFVYPPARPFTLAVLPPELRRYVCVAGSFSKTFAMTGWRAGYTIAPPKWTAAMVKLQSHSATHPTSFVQYACALALEHSGETMAAKDEMLAEYSRRREWFIPALNSIEPLKCAVPEGAFYAYVDVRGLMGGEFTTSAEIADRLLRDAHVVVTDGAGFGTDGFLRLSYATSMEHLKAAVEKIREFVGGLS